MHLPRYTSTAITIAKTTIGSSISKIVSAIAETTIIAAPNGMENRLPTFNKAINDVSEVRLETKQQPNDTGPISDSEWCS